MTLMTGIIDQYKEWRPSSVRYSVLLDLTLLEDRKDDDAENVFCNLLIKISLIKCK